VCFSFWFGPSLSSLADMWATSFISFPFPAPLEPGRAAASIRCSRLSPPPGSALHSLTLPHHQDPSLTPLNLAPTINGVKAIYSGRFHPLPPPPALIKGRVPPLEHPAHFPLVPELSLVLLCSRTELESPLLFIVVLPPLRHHSCSSEHPSGTTSSCLSSSATIGEHRQPLARGCIATVKRHQAHCSRHSLVHRGPGHSIGPQHRGPSPRVF
jgi:hypothetical protein